MKKLFETTTQIAPENWWFEDEKLVGGFNPFEKY